MSNYREEQKSKEEEFKTLQEEMHNSRQQVLTRKEEVESLKQEFVEFKEDVKKLKYQLSVSEKFNGSTKAVNKILILQMFARDKKGLGQDVIKGSSSITQEDVEEVQSWDDVSKDISKKQKNHKEMKSIHHNFAHPPKMKNFRRHGNEKSLYKQKNQRFSKHTFFGYCHCCHKFGDKDDDYRIKE